MEVTSLQRRPARPYVMGILNVTPDSFSDGGLWADTDAALAHAAGMLDAGADIIDVGGESTRPGAARPPLAAELERVIPVVTALAHDEAIVSVDTMRAEVAEAAIEAGAVIVNDVSGGLADPRMAAVIAQSGVWYVAMHWRAHSHTMQERAVYDDVVSEVRSELDGRVGALVAAGADPTRIVLDPGLGFAKTADHNWALLQQLDVIADLGFPLLIGASRKSFLGHLLADDAGLSRPVNEREPANIALTALLAARAPDDLWGVRVHDVRSSRDALAVVSRLGRLP